MPTECFGRHGQESRGVNTKWLSWIVRGAPGGKHCQAGERQAFGTGEAPARIGIVVAPACHRPGVEQNPKDRKIQGRARPPGAVLPRDRRLKPSPPVLAVDREVAPTRMQWHVELRIG